MSKQRYLQLISITVLLFAGSCFAYSGGTGEPNTPYQITNVSDWQQLMTSSADWNKYFIMTADLDMQGIALTPVGIYDGTSGVSFSGKFDGNNHIIKNVNIYMPDSDYIGLFGLLGSGGQILNLGVEDVNIYANGHVGALVGMIGATGGTVSNCYTTGMVTGYTCLYVIDRGGYVGGLVGKSCGNITECYSTCTVNGSTYCIGGLVGMHTGGYECVITSSYATGVVSGREEVGGLVGYNDGFISQCYSTGDVCGSYDVGGLVGYENYNNGGVVYSFWDVNTSGQTTSAGGTGKTTAQMKTESTFTSTGWDFSYTDGNDAVWYMAMNSYPILVWQISPADIYTDGRNNFRDFAVLARFWMRDDCRMYNNFCDWADLNFDGSVDIDDLVIFMTYWLKSGIYE
jgi:hypothetical protein